MNKFLSYPDKEMRQVVVDSVPSCLQSYVAHVQHEKISLAEDQNGTFLRCMFPRQNGDNRLRFCCAVNTCVTNLPYLLDDQSGRCPALT